MRRGGLDRTLPTRRVRRRASNEDALPHARVDIISASLARQDPAAARSTSQPMLASRRAADGRAKVPGARSPIGWQGSTRRPSPGGYGSAGL